MNTPMNVASMDFPTDYEKIIERVEQIDPVEYGKTRNFINGKVTYLSPYISRGIISSKLVMDTVLRKGYQLCQIEKLLQELAWREYFQRVWQEKGDHIWQDIKQPQTDVLHQNMIRAVHDADTKIVAIDKAIQELYQSGYLHNHFRMYIASLVCNISKAAWSEPSRWIYYHLLDGDIASNNCSWQWVAGAFASKKYYFNQENLNKYTSDTQRNTVIDTSYEEIGKITVPAYLQHTMNCSLTTGLPAAAKPVLDNRRPTLLYNSYNLDVLWRRDEMANRILLLEPSHFKKYPVSQKVIRFLISLSDNIPGIQLFCGEIDELDFEGTEIISKEHPLFTHYPGTKDSRDWMFSEVKGYYPSFFAYWKACKKYLP